MAHSDSVHTKSAPSGPRGKAGALNVENIEDSWRPGIGKPVVQALRSISLVIPFESGTAILGHKGAGKSALLKILGGASQPSKGLLKWDGVTIESSHRDRMGFVPQWWTPIPGLRVGEMVELSLHGRGFGPRSHRLDMALGSLSQWKLSHRVDTPADRLTPSEHARFGWALATAHSPEVLLLDDAFLGLDLEGLDLAKSFLERHQAARKTLVMAGNRPEEILTWTENVCILRQGQIAWQSTPGQRLASTNQTIEIEVSGLDRVRADEWRKNLSLPMWESFDAQGFLARVTFVEQADAAKWLQQVVQSNMVVLYFGPGRKGAYSKPLGELAFFLQDPRESDSPSAEPSVRGTSH